MQQITIIFGLPGSGKTTYVEANRDKFNNAFVCDNYHHGGKTRDFLDSFYYDDLCDALKKGKNIILTDIAWCKPDRFDLMFGGLQKIISNMKIIVEFDYIYFENNPIQCKKNILYRGRTGRVQRELSYVDSASPLYIIPKDAFVLPVLDAIAN